MLWLSPNVLMRNNCDSFLLLSANAVSSLREYLWDILCWLGTDDSLQKENDQGKVEEDEDEDNEEEKKDEHKEREEKKEEIVFFRLMPGMGKNIWNGKQVLALFKDRCFFCFSNAMS